MGVVEWISIIASDGWYYFNQFIWPRFLQVVLAWYEHPEMIWTILPLLAATTLMVLYFGRHKNEKLGWNTAFGNTISLFFIIASLAQGLILQYRPADFFDLASPYLLKFGQPLYQVVFLVLLGLEALLLMHVNYYHKIPERWSFLFSSTIPVNGISLLAILIIKGGVPLDRITVYTAVLFFLVFWAIFSFLGWEVTPSKEAKAVLTRQQNIARVERKKRINALKARAAERWSGFKSHFKWLWE